VINSYLRKTGLRFGDFFMKTRVSKDLELIRKLSHYSSDEIIDWQINGLRKLINHAFNNTAYYKDLFKQGGISPDSIKDFRDLKKIPALTRHEVIENYNDFIASDLSKYPFKKAHTGGTTGPAMKYLSDLKSWSYSNANYIFNWEKSGYQFGDRYLALGSTSINSNKNSSLKHKAYYFLKNRVNVNGMTMTDEISNSYIDLINEKRIKYLYGYASSLYLLARFVLKNQKKINISACFTTSELLTDIYRKTIIEAFNCEIVNCYGANDAGITAFSFRNSDFMVGYNTIIDKESLNVKNSDVGSILTTNLFNYSFPMINYKVGDIVRMSVDNSDYNGQTFKSILGRTTDIMEFGNGKVMTSIGFYTNVFKYLPVESFRLKQSGINEVICQIKTSNGFEPHHEDKIRSGLQEYAGQGVKINVIRVDNFDDSSSGKLGFTVVN
jgi:phenylacetate-CoA ligase